MTAFRSPIALIALAMLVAGPAHAQSAARRGEAIAKEQCARCHAIGGGMKSPLVKAPPLRTLSTKYPLETLEEAFAEGIVVSHKSPEMPPFEMEPRQIDDLIAYLKSLRPKRR